MVPRAGPGAGRTDGHPRHGACLDGEGRFGCPSEVVREYRVSVIPSVSPAGGISVSTLLWLVNGIVFYVLLFTTGQWRRIVPRSWDVIPNAMSTAVQYASLELPANEGFTSYNGMQMIAYFLTVFVAAPLAFITGLLQAPSIAARFGFGRGVLNRQVARSIHFAILLWMVFFIVVHTVMVLVTGFIGNLNHIVLGTNTDSYWPLAIYVIAMVVLAGLWLVASPLTIRYPAAIQRTGRWMVGWVKALMEWVHPKATYSEKDISPYFWPNGHPPDSERYRELQRSNWADFSLRVEGLVDNPVSISYERLRSLPKHEQITQHYCIQGWSGVAKWGGARMSDVMDLVGPQPSANWVVFGPVRRWGQSRHGPVLRLPPHRAHARPDGAAGLRDERSAPTRNTRCSTSVTQRNRTRIQAGEVDRRDRVRRVLRAHRGWAGRLQRGP